MNHSQHFNLTIKRMVNLGWGGNMPREFQQVEWIKGQGGQYIDTEIVPDAHTGIEASGVFSGRVNNDNLTLFGCRYSLYETNYTLQATSENKLRLCFGTNNLNWFNLDSCNKFSFIPDSELKFRYTQNGVDGFMNVNSKNFRPALNMNFYLFGCNGTGGVGGGTCTVEYFKMYSGLVLIRHFIPCYRKLDDKTGMYDIVTRAFFPNLGTGEFIIGPEV